MFRRSIILGLILTASSSVIFTQQPAPAPRAEGRALMVFPQDDSGYLGIQGVAITSENLSQFGLKEARGVGIDKVMENSPAEKAGLQKGDVVIRFDGEEVKSSAKLSRMIAEVAPDQKAKLTILRNGDEREITVTMGKRAHLTFERGVFPAIQGIPSAPFPPAAEFKLNDEMFKNLPQGQFPQGSFTWNFSSGRRIGIVSEPLTKQLGDHFGVADGKGLLVMEVRADSPAAKAGIKAGDIIVEANGKSIAGTTDLVQQINLKKEGDMEITFIRDKNRQTVKVTPEQAKDGETFFQGQPGEFKVFTAPRPLPAPAPGAPSTPSAPPAAPAAPAPVSIIS